MKDNLNTKLFIIVGFLIIFSQGKKCETDSKYYVKSIFGFDTAPMDMSCIYSGLIEKDLSNHKIFFILVKSQYYRYVSDADNHSPLIIWLNEPGESSIKSFLIETTQFKINSLGEFSVNTQESINMQSDMLFIDYPGEIGYSVGNNQSSLDEIIIGFSGFIKDFQDLKLVDFEKQNIFLMGNSWILPHLAKELNSQNSIIINNKIKKVGLINSVLDFNQEVESRSDLAKGLSILSAWDESTYDHLKQKCEFEMFNLNDSAVCSRINEFLIKVSGDISLSDVRVSLFSDNAKFEAISKIMNLESTMKEFNVLPEIVKKSNSMCWIAKNPEVVFSIKDPVTKHQLIYKYNEKLFENEIFHTYFITGQYNLDYGSRETTINKLVTELENEHEGYWKVPADQIDATGSHFWFHYLNSKNADSSNIIKGFIKQSERYTHLTFKDAGKHIGFSDMNVFKYFVKTFFLDTETSRIPCADENINYSPNIPNEIEVISSKSKESIISSVSSSFSIQSISQSNSNSTSILESTGSSASSSNLSSITLTSSSSSSSSESIVKIKNKGGCPYFKDLCKILNDCSGNGICDESTKGKCSCIDKFYGPSCSLKEEALTKNTKLKLSASDIKIFTPQNSFDFIISDNLLFEIDSNHSDIILSLVSKKEHFNIYDYTKHLYFQKLEKKQVIFYLDKSQINDLLVVVTNIHNSDDITIRFNICNFNTKSTEFFGPGGIGFILALFIFTIGLAAYVSVNVLYKDQLSSQSKSKFDDKNDNTIQNLEDDKNAIMLKEPVNRISIKGLLKL